MIKIAHLLDDFGMGGVTRALTLFDEPDFIGVAKSQVISVNAKELVAPALNADLIIDHMALSWRRLVFLTSLRAIHVPVLYISSTAIPAHSKPTRLGHERGFE